MWPLGSALLFAVPFCCHLPLPVLLRKWAGEQHGNSTYAWGRDETTRKGGKQDCLDFEGGIEKQLFQEVWGCHNCLSIDLRGSWGPGSPGCCLKSDLGHGQYQTESEYGQKHRGKWNGKIYGKKAQMHGAARKPNLPASVGFHLGRARPNSIFHRGTAETNNRNSGLQDSHRNHPFVLVSKNAAKIQWQTVLS